MENNNKSATLKKSISPFLMLTLAAGTMIGPWLAEMSWWFSLTGASIVLSFLVCGLLILPVCFCYAELTPMLPFAGGEYHFIRSAFGRYWGYWGAWCLVLTYLVIVPNMSLLLMRVIQGAFLPDLTLMHIQLGAIIILFIFTLLNLSGVVLSAIVQCIMTLLILAVGYFISGFMFISSPHWNTANLTPFFATGLNGWIVATGLMTALYVGFDCIPQLVEEAKYDPKLNGRIMIGSVLLAMSLYSIVCFGNGGIKPWTWIREQVLVDPNIALEFFGVAPAAILTFTAMFALLTTLNGFILGTTRLLFALGRSRALPLGLGKLNSRQVPHAASWVVFVIGVAIILLAGEYWLATIISLISVNIGFVYVLTCASAGILRKTRAEWKRPYHMPGGAKMAVAGTIAGLIILFAAVFGVTIRGWIILGLYLLLGAIIFIYMENKRKTSPELYADIDLTPEDIKDVEGETDLTITV